MDSLAEMSAKRDGRQPPGAHVVLPHPMTSHLTHRHPLPLAGV